MAQVIDIHRYPIKGLGVETLESVALAAGQPLPGDRVYAIAKAGGAVDPDHPAWASKSHFIQLMGEARLARLETGFERSDDGGLRLTLRDKGETVADVRVDQAQGRARLERFLSRFLAEESERSAKYAEGIRVVAGDDGVFQDRRPNYVSIINLASLRAFEADTGATIDPLRFRCNLIVDGIPPWSEFEWLERTLAVGDAGLKVEKRIVRCPATTVDPSAGTRNLETLKLLKEHYGHIDFGVLATVETGATIRRGDSVVIL